MPDKLIVKNFGPLKDVEIDLHKVMIFIGPQGSGKSTLAKLVGVFRGLQEAETNLDISSFSMFAEKFNLGFLLKEGIQIEMRPEKGDFYILNKHILGKTNDEGIFKDFRFHYEKEEGAGQLLQKTIYVPAERIFTSMASGAFFNLAQNNVPISKPMIEFGANFEKARSKYPEYSIDFLDVTYRYMNGQDYISKSGEYSIKLNQAASGMQTTIPLMLVLEYFANKNGSDHTYIIEEPELNLFPKAQKDLVEFLVEKCTKEEDELVITTHSPYILTAFNNLIQASNTAKERPEAKDKINEQILESLWLDYEDVAVYYVDNGTVTLIMDDEYRVIDGNPIDKVAEELEVTFENLLSIEYGEQ